MYGKCLIYYLIGLTIAFIFLMIRMFIESSKIEINDNLCKSIGYISYLSFCFTFIWLNIISFELWARFR